MSSDLTSKELDWIHIMEPLITKFLRIIPFSEIPFPYPYHLEIKSITLINESTTKKVKNDIVSSSKSLGKFGWEDGITQVGLCPAYQA